MTTAPRSPLRRRALLAVAAAAAWIGVGSRLRRTSGSSPLADAVAAAPESGLCANGSTFENPLALPGRDGWMGFYPVVEPVKLGAMAVADAPTSLAYVIRSGVREWRNPVLLVESKAAMRVAFDNGLAEPTIVHWHGLRVDSANDGNGDRVAAPGARFDYAFQLADRAGIFWYHPHPHGLTAGQAYLGLYAMMLVDDDEDRALGKALATTLGSTDLPLVLSDRRNDARGRYAPTDADRQGGYLGDEMLVNGTVRAYANVSTRGYRLRVLNAANARTLRLAFRGDDGKLLSFRLLGTDGGLLSRAIECRELFVATAERVDLWVDFAGRAIGDSVVLESLAFDPMHGEMHGMASDASTDAGAGAGVPRQMGHDQMGHDQGGHDQGGPDHGGHAADGGSMSTIGDGARLSLLQFRIRERVAPSPGPPATLSTLPAAPRVDSANPAVPFRLSWAKARWRINDRTFDSQDGPIVVPRNTTQTWLLRNYYTSMPHAMHLHGFSMRVLARETSPEFIRALAVDSDGRLPTDLGVKDTLLVWPGESVRVAIDFACAFAGPQDYLLHCHNLEHEDGGMMLRVRVV